MNEPDEDLRELLRRAITPMDADLKRDLWPQMLRKLDERSVRVSWLDWALAALLTLWLLFFPEAIPVLLYQL